MLSVGFFNYLSMALSLSLLTDHTIITTLSWCQLPTWFLNDLRDFLKVVPGVSRSAVNHPSQTLMQLPSTWKMLSSSVSITFFLPLMLLVSITHYTAIVKLLQRTKWLAYPPNDSEESSPVSTSSTGSTEKMTSSPMALTCTTLEVATMVQETMAAIFYLGNHYGLFAHMTKERNEIIIQIAHSNRSTVHSKDEKDMKNVEWDILDFPFKPDDIFKPPKTVRPFFHMPRLDWMMWFQAFRPLPSYYQKWLWNFLISVLEQNEDVLSLLTEKTRKDLNRHWFYVQRMKEMQESKGNKDGTDKKSEDEGGRPQVKTSKKVVIEDQLQEADVYLRILFQKFEYYPKKQVAEKSSSGSTAASSATDVDNKEEEAGKKQYWSAKNLGVLLPPANLQDLYSLFDGQYSNRMNITKKKTGAPSVESAQDIILRTLFRNAEKRKQQQKEAEEASSHSSSLSQSDTSSTASGKKDL